MTKIEKVWSRPAAWLVQGTAVHEAAEAFERSGRAMTLADTQTAFREAYSRDTSRYTEITPNFDWWFPSGRYAGAVDVERRFNIGLEQTEKYVNWYNNHPEEVIWIAPDGTPGIELGFDIDLDGVRVRGFIDAIIEVDHGLGSTITVRDNKTGNNPGDDFQLGVYGVAIAERYWVEPERGDYWMGRSGKPTYPFDLTDWTRNRVAEKFHQLQENINDESFDPIPSADNCRFCDVAYSCEYRAG